MNEHGKREPGPQARVVLSYMGTRGMNITDLVRATGIGRSTISKFLNGYWQTLQMEMLLKFSTALGIPMDLLLGTGRDAGGGASAALATAMLCHVCMGPDGPMFADLPSKCTLVFNPEAIGMPSLMPGHRLCAVPVEGDSMAPLLCHGDLVVLDVDPDAFVNISDHAVYMFAYGGNTHIRRLSVSVRGEITATAENPVIGTDRITVDEAAGGGFRIMGKAVGMFRHL